MSLNNSKTSLYLILGIPLLGLLLTTAYYFYVTGQGIRLETQNNGILITPPKLITEVELREKDGNSHQWYTGTNKWTFLVVGTADCDAACQKKMYLSRQIHSAVGKESLRINTVYLNVDPSLSPATAELFASEYPHFQVLSANAAQLAAWATKTAPALDLLQAGNFYLVDPAGWVMMYYTDAHTYKAVIKDIKFLLKNS